MKLIYMSLEVIDPLEAILRIRALRIRTYVWAILRMYVHMTTYVLGIPKCVAADFTTMLFLLLRRSCTVGLQMFAV